MKKISNPKFQMGFTLAEMLVVVAGIALVGMMITEVFYRSVRASNKATILGTIKQNGQATLEIMDKIIRASDAILCTTTGPGTVLLPATIVIVKDGIYSRYRFKIETEGVDKVNGSVIMDNPPTDISPDSVCSGVMSTFSTLTDTNAKTGVSVYSGEFKRNKSPGFNDTLTINFALKPAVGTAQSIASQISPVDFNTTIELR